MIYSSPSEELLVTVNPLLRYSQQEQSTSKERLSPDEDSLEAKKVSQHKKVIQNRRNLRRKPRVAENMKASKNLNEDAAEEKDKMEEQEQDEGESEKYLLDGTTLSLAVAAVGAVLVALLLLR